MGEMADLDEACMNLNHPSAHPGAIARDAGATLALEAEPHKFALEFALSKAARTLQEFTADHVWEILGVMGVSSLEHPNAFGAQFLVAARAGIIENTGRVCKSDRQGSNRRAVAVWKSLIFKPTRETKVQPKVKSANPISNFFLNEAPPADGTDLGRKAANNMVATLKRDHTDMDLTQLLGYLVAWNDRGGSPFTLQELQELSKVEPYRRPKRKPRPGPEAFAVQLLEL